MVIFVVIFTCIHVLTYLCLYLGWSKIPDVGEGDVQRSFSILIPVRNEEKNILSLLQDLTNQNYPPGYFEVIVVNDFSEDKTAQLVADFSEQADISVRLVDLENRQKTGKKNALSTGVVNAKYDYIITTDADCRVPKTWLECYNKAFLDDSKMVAGPVAIEGRGLFADMQQVEFAGLLGLGAITISNQTPFTCSGANLGFQKEAFEKVGGYSNNMFTPSGDDEFLLYNIMTSYPGSTRFLKSKGAIVQTAAHGKLLNFINQRKRWSSKWKFNKNWKAKVSVILFFLNYSTLLAGALATIYGSISIEEIMVILCLRLVAEYLYISKVNRFMGGKNTLFALLALQIIYPLHVLLMGLTSIFGSYTWKGRKYE